MRAAIGRFNTGRPFGAPASPGPEETATETVRREIVVGACFSTEAFAEAFAQFRKIYNTEPLRAFCAPDVFARYCELFERSAAAAHRHSTRARYEGVPLEAAILRPGVVAFEGEVDEERMGDW